jgi:hypothetical protein
MPQAEHVIDVSRIQAGDTSMLVERKWYCITVQENRCCEKPPAGTWWGTAIGQFIPDCCYGNLYGTAVLTLMLDDVAYPVICRDVKNVIEMKPSIPLDD